MLKKTAARQGGFAPAQSETTAEPNPSRNIAIINEGKNTAGTFGKISPRVSRNVSGRHDTNVPGRIARANNKAVMPKLTSAARSDVPSSSLRKAFMPAYISSAITANLFRPIGSATSLRRLLLAAKGPARMRPSHTSECPVFGWPDGFVRRSASRPQRDALTPLSTPPTLIP
jgi:hypothetical protein